MISEDLFLTGEEVEFLTGYKQVKKQASQLVSVGIPFFLNGESSPVVSRATVLDSLSPKNFNSRKVRRISPNLS